VNPPTALAGFAQLRQLLSLEEAEEAAVWSARALVRVALQDAGGGDG
jgi:hypothetical protein